MTADPVAKPGLRERKKQEKLDRIKRAARALFSKRGFHSTTIRDVAARAGVATGTARALRGSWKLLGIQAPSVTAGWAYVLSLLRAGKFSLALARLAGASDTDLAPWFHSRGAHNLSGIADAELDAALEGYRHALTRDERDAAKRAVAARLAALHPVSVLHAPVAVLLASRALLGLEFIDDLPRLDSLGLGVAPPVLLHTGGG